METNMIWANLASEDLNRTEEFYTTLGFQKNGAGNSELVSFFFSNNNFIIHFFVKEVFEKSASSKSPDLSSQNEIIFSLSAKSVDEVDQWYLRVKAAGATIYSEPQNYLQGYTFGFCDPDGHKFNFLYWPGM